MLKNVRIVLDTNVLIDGFSDDFSAQARLIGAVREGAITAVITPAIEREYRLILQRLINDPVYREKITDFLSMTQRVTPQRVTAQIDDAQDYKILQAAVGGQADCIVTHDHHLLSLGEIEGIPIRRPQEAWTVFEDSSDGSSSWRDFVRGIGIGAVILLMIGYGVAGTRGAAAVPNEAADQQQLIQAKQQEIDALTAKIAALQSRRDTTAAEAEVAAAQLQQLKQQLAKAELERTQTQQNIQATQKESAAVGQEIDALQTAVAVHQEHLGELVRQLYEQEHGSLIQMFFTSDSLGDVLAQRAAYQKLQQDTVTVIQAMRHTEDDLHARQQQLSDKQQELQALHTLLAAQENDISVQQRQQAAFVHQKQSKQATYEARLAEAERARQEISQDLFTLKNAHVKVTLTQATDMARYAAKLTGVRAALLLAVLKVESNVGASIGSGTFPDDMHPDSREPFLRITKKLGLDPYKAPISARPRSFAGWGGAMGPGQFMPATWEAMSDRLEKLVGHTPNPYDLTDAFVATALFLADKGATNPAQEYEAVNRYIAGPNWQRFTWYGDRVLAVAKEYANQGL